MEKPLVDKEYLLERFSGKGGWTYTELPEIPMGKASFGMLKVKGTIDGFEIKKYNLMPFGNGNLFLPVKAEIRKKIKKQAGDFIHVILYLDNEPLAIPDEFMLCLEDDSEALDFFNSLNDSEQHNYIKWIYSAKTDETKVDRMAKSLVRLGKQQKWTNQ